VFVPNVFSRIPYQITGSLLAAPDYDTPLLENDYLEKENNCPFFFSK
jgi:hypothetical protein